MQIKLTSANELALERAAKEAHRTVTQEANYRVALTFQKMFPPKSKTACRQSGK